MKIAIFSDCYLDLTGGIIQVINSQKAELEKLGHTVYIFSTGFRRSETELKKLATQNIFVVPSCRLFFKGLTPVSRRPKIIENWLLKNHPEIKDFDIFYIHYESGCSIAGLRLARKLKIPSVQMMHGREDMGVSTVIPYGFRTIAATLLNWFHSWYIPHTIKISPDNYLTNTIAKAKMWTLMVNHANYADVVITPSAHFKKKLRKYGVSKLIKVVPNGYPDEKFLRKVQVKELALGETLRMIWHSRVQGEKRIMPFLKALTMVDGKWQMDVYGGGTELSKAKRYAKRHKLPIKFHGDVKFSAVQKAILNSHLDVMASYNYDTFGMTLIEARACGVPVFFCDPDMREIVPVGSYIMSKSETPADMAAALNNLLAHPKRIKQMSEIILAHRDDILASHRIKILIQLFQNAQVKK
ncbi:glycosyltransferase [Candidatus Saccharibacteria bacterium]|nr:glycosyltransferase [Candidatus Saccharibacteria bacterium]